MKPPKEAAALQERLRAVSAKVAAWSGTAYRVVGTRYANKRDLLSGEGTKRFGGRWTPIGSFATVHASLDVRTAVAESLGTHELYGIAVAARLPLTLVAVDIYLQKVIDLTDATVVAGIELTRRRLLRCRWRDSMAKGREPLTQAVGRIAFGAGLEGLLVPSAQARRGVNLLVFPENLLAGSSLAIQNADRLPPVPD